MLVQFLEKAAAIGSDAIEIEYKDHKEWIFAYSGCMGCGIGSVDSNSEQSKSLFKELAELKKRKRVTLDGVSYRLAFSQRDSFGEPLYRIEMKVEQSGAAGKL